MPSMAWLEILTSIINTGIIIGTLKIAIKLELLRAFEAMAEIRLKEKENDKLPNKIFRKKSGRLRIGISKTT